MKMKKSNKENRIVVTGDLDLTHSNGSISLDYTEIAHKSAIVIDDFYSRLNEIEESYEVVDNFEYVFDKYIKLIAKSEQENRLFVDNAEMITTYLTELIPINGKDFMYASSIKSIEIVIDNVVYELDYNQDEVNSILHEMIEYIDEFEKSRLQNVNNEI